MESHSVIVLFDVDRHVPAQVPEIPTPVRVNLLLLQRFQETLAAGVVIRVRLAEWRILHTKAGRPHLLPLPHTLVTLLLGLPRVVGNPYVFPGRHGAAICKI